MTRPYAEVIGDPISHSKSPRIHGFWLHELGIEADFRACHVRSDELAGYFAGRRKDPLWRGCNVTLPHKEAIAPLLDRIGPRAQAIGAINTVYRDGEGALIGANTDVDGVADAITGIDLAGRVVCVIGAGGAARAAFALLAERGCAEVRVLARNADKARRVAAECGIDARPISFEEPHVALEGAGLLINATQLGMSGQDQMPGNLLSSLAAMAPDGLVFDMVYAPLETQLLASARAVGLKTSDGLVMLVGQAATAFERFFGQPAARESDAKLRDMLTS